MLNHANEAVSQQPDHPNDKKHIIIADSGATAHYGMSDLPVLNKVPCTKEICIRTANGAIMKATHEAELDIPALPIAARHIYIVTDLADKTLLSVSQLCKANCQVVFNDRTVTVHHDGKTVLKGGMQDGTALWKMEMPGKRDDVLEFTANTAIFFNTAAEIVQFMHAALGYPALATLDKALAIVLIKGFPGLTQKTLRSHPPFSDATVKGHMAQTRKNVRSTIISQQKLDGEAEIPASQNKKKPNNAQHEPGGAGNGLLHMNRNYAAELYLSNYVASVLIGSYERISLAANVRKAYNDCNDGHVPMCAHDSRKSGNSLSSGKQNRPA
jgi:hypothetical protein